MTGRKKPEFTLRGQPSRILARLRPAFKTHVRPHTENQRGERLGGGSILNAQWNHRLSRDIDVYLRLVSKEDGRAILDRAAKACNGYRVEHPNFPRIEFERDKDNHIDINLKPPTPEKGERIAVVDGEETAVLNNAQIMTGKLKGRGMSSPGRDVFDVAVCRLADPEALEIAVNTVDDLTLDGILNVYEVTRDQYKKEATELEGIPKGLKPIQEDPVGYANDAILESRYERVALQTVDGKAEIKTRTAGGRQRVRTYDSAEELVEGMEREGMNAFLEAQYRNAQAVLNDVIDNIWTGRKTTIIVVEPQKPEHELLSLPQVDWSPPGNDENGGGERGGITRTATAEPIETAPPHPGDENGQTTQGENPPTAKNRQENPVRGKGRPVGGASTLAPETTKNRKR